ncbi:MAG: response regulator [Bacteroidales bacterium]
MKNQLLFLVEDNPLEVDLTLHALKTGKLENQVVVVRDGEEALGYITKWDGGEATPFLILLDIKLPRVSGLEVLRKFKSHWAYRTIPVVMLTSSSEEADVRTALELGANSYIVKPVNFERFVELTTALVHYWSHIHTGVRTTPGSIQNPRP